MKIYSIANGAQGAWKTTFLFLFFDSYLKISDSRHKTTLILTLMLISFSVANNYYTTVGKNFVLQKENQIGVSKIK